MIAWILRWRQSSWAWPGGSTEKDVVVPKGAVEKSVGGEGRSKRQSAGKVCAWMSKLKGEGLGSDAARTLFR
jgi:hypothetical protein